ncbi:hypothetical protein DSECCO2_586550 [anaerobic digester metagenome]
MGGKNIDTQGLKGRAADGHGNDIGGSTRHAHAHENRGNHDEHQGRQQKSTRPRLDDGGYSQRQTGIGHDADHHSGSGAGDCQHDEVLSRQFKRFIELFWSHPCITLDEGHQEGSQNSIDSRHERRIPDDQKNDKHNKGNQLIRVFQDLFR